MIKNPPAMQETWVQSLGWEDPLEKRMATHSSIPAWRIPWTEEPGRLQPMGWQRVGHDWATNTLGLPWWFRQERICLKCGRPGISPWVWKIPSERERQPIPVFSSGEFHGWRSLVGYSSWGCKELDMIVQLTQCARRRGACRFACVTALTLPRNKQF